MARRRRAGVGPRWRRRRCRVLAAPRSVGRGHRPGHGFPEHPRPASDRSPASTPASSEGWGAVRRHAHGGDPQLAHHIARGWHPLEQAGPHPASGPPGVAIADRGRRAGPGRQVAPAAACLRHRQNAADEATVVDPGSARLTARTLRPQHVTGSIRRPGEPRHRRSAPAMPIRIEKRTIASRGRRGSGPTAPGAGNGMALLPEPTRTPRACGPERHPPAAQRRAAQPSIRQSASARPDITASTRARSASKPGARSIRTSSM